MMTVLKTKENVIISDLIRTYDKKQIELNKRI